MLLNLNADLGESFGPWPMGDDQRLLQLVDSANVACGFHAGDPLVMSRTIRAALAAGVSIGAHPGFADLQGFGRRPMTLPADELRALIQYQLAALDGVSRSMGLTMSHVKPHGALNNMACEDRDMADIVVQAVSDYDNTLILLAPVMSQLAAAATESSLTTALEIFADRAYTSTGALVSRRKPGAVLESAEDCISHVKAMIEAQGIVTEDGTVLSTEFHSICVHGDNAHAVDTAQRIRTELLDQGHELLSLPSLMQRH
ncbi:LamB/YcsF family protein [Granulosicoccus sp. 3-233]|uniref:LamB/YcsF family protein n=1 Tax=Granulosicoccus sp. 3-233 TaxID=3417969 RepID=UPI003D33848A